jgi:hypothetical protein
MRSMLRAEGSLIADLRDSLWTVSKLRKRGAADHRSRNAVALFARLSTRPNHPERLRSEHLPGLDMRLPGFSVRLLGFGLRLPS